jgi:hypothetical protein
MINVNGIRRGIRRIDLAGVRHQICLDRLVGDRELVVLRVVSKQFRLVLSRL